MRTGLNVEFTYNIVHLYTVKQCKIICIPVQTEGKHHGLGLVARHVHPRSQIQLQGWKGECYYIVLSMTIISKYTVLCCDVELIDSLIKSF